MEKSIITDPLRMDFTISFVMSTGERLPGTSTAQMTASANFTNFSILCLVANIVVTLLPAV